MFVHLHLHTHYSIFDSTAIVSDIVARVKELGQPGFAITDHGTTSGLFDGWKKAKKKGLKFVFGAEFYIATNIDEKSKDYYHLVVLAKNNVGYQNLLKLMTLAHENVYYKPRINFEMLEAHKEGLIVTSACLGGLLKRNDAEEWATRFKEVFGKDFYIELHTNSMPEQRQFNYKVADIARRLDIPVIAAVDSHYVRKEDASVHRKWKGIGEDDDTAHFQTDDYYLMEEDDVRQRLNYLTSFDQAIVEEAIHNTGKILEMCDVSIDTKTKHYPIFPVDNQFEFLKGICRQGWREKIINRVPKSEWATYEERIHHELDVLEKADYINYFLITWDILNWCKQVGIYTGIGRGSVTASLVAYLMGITKIDPVKYGLIFQRFAHLERVTPPDIDTDVMQERRGEVIDYIRAKYGHVYQVRTWGLMGAKGALNRAGQALNYEASVIKELSKRIMLTPDDKEEKHKQALEDCITEQEHFELKELAKKFIGIIQNTSKHASAVVVFPQEPSAFCAIERQDDSFVAAYDFHDLESMGILKQDVLGLKTTDVIKNTLDLVDEDIDIDNLPEKDSLTFDMLCEGHTQGCFQIESKGMTDLVKKISPREYVDLIPLVALYRPGPLHSGMVEVFINGRNGGKIHYVTPELSEILDSTYGIILYQEQILQIARNLCRYTLGEGDMIRRAVGRKEKETMDKIIPEFVQRGVQNGIKQEAMEQIADQIITFASYGFNMGHSAAYGYISYQTAYLKAHYPVQYMCCLINSEQGTIENTVPYILEAKRMGIKILPPDINKSQYKWTVEGDAIRTGFMAIKNVGTEMAEIAKIEDRNYTFDTFMEAFPKSNRRGIESLIKAGGFGKESKGMLLAKLEWHKNYGKKIQDYKDKMVEAEVDAMIRFEVPDLVGNKEMFKELVSRITKARLNNESDEVYEEELCQQYKEEYEKSLEFLQDSLFTEVVSKKKTNRKPVALETKLATIQEKIDAIPKIDSIYELPIDDCECEAEVLGFCFTDKFERYDLSNKEGLVGGEVTSFKPWEDKNGNPMAFLKVRTKDELIECALFHKAYKPLREKEVYLFRFSKDKRSVALVKDAPKKTEISYAN